MINRKIPLRCLNCGNTVLTPRDAVFEVDAKSIAMSHCIICDESGENWETFYVDHNDRMFSFGEWMDRELFTFLIF